jgi:hypothetical protein
MDGMQGNEGRFPETEKGMVASATEASFRLQVTDLLLGGLRNVRIGPLTLEQSEVLQQMQAALEAYGSYFYPPEDH